MPPANTPPATPVTPTRTVAAARIPLLAITLGAAAGALTALVLWLMQALSAVLWSHSGAWWSTFLTIMVGGVLLVLLHHLSRRTSVDESLGEQIAETRDQLGTYRSAALITAASAIVAVGFGGAIGPEAGIIAVVGQLGALVSYRLARSRAEARLLSDIGTAGALGGLYGSPPGGAVAADEAEATPRWQLFLAGLAGLIGFAATAGVILPGHGLRLPLPEVTPSGRATDILAATLPALLGALAGLAFTALLPLVQAALSRIGGASVQILLGTSLFALLASAWPILRFSGHHELQDLAQFAADVGPWALLGVAGLKILALCLCLASGWKGGAAFPLLFIGAAIGLAVHLVLPGISPTVALVAAMSAALTAGIGKPLAGALVSALILGLPAVGPLCLGIAAGWGASKLAPSNSLH
ncbi:MAG: chloride channel protein [Dermabacter sp.]|nr:chloride channel protein [Dermabacter sp.]